MNATGIVISLVRPTPDVDLAPLVATLLRVQGIAATPQGLIIEDWSKLALE